MKRFALCLVLVLALTGASSTSPLNEISQYEEFDKLMKTIADNRLEHFAEAPGGDSRPATYDDLDAFIAQTLKCSPVPGVAVGVVQRGEVKFNKPYGLRDAEKGLPVTDETLFGIGSTSKAFTGLLATMLHEEGLLDIDAPVHEIITAIAFDNEFASARTTLRDMMTHRTGMPRHDMCVLLGRFNDRDDLARSLKYLSTNAELRTRWQYNNAMWALVGEAAGTASGSVWEQLVKDRIFDPLGMTSTAVNFVSAKKKTNNLAIPVAGKGADGDWLPIDWTANYDIDPMGPAGSINSNVEDMLKWIKFGLGDGTIDGGRRLVSEAGLNMTHAPQMLVDIPGPNTDENKLVGYGFGWIIADMHGVKVTTHNGGTFGHITQVYLMRSTKTGVVVLSNSLQAASLTQAISSYAIAVSYGVRAPMTAEEFCRAITNPTPTPQSDSNEELGEELGSDDEEYNGVYSHPGYGVIKIAGGRADLNNRLSGSLARRTANRDVLSVTLAVKSIWMSIPVMLDVHRGLDGRPDSFVLKYVTDAEYSIPFSRMDNDKPAAQPKGETNDAGHLKNTSELIDALRRAVVA